MKHIYRSLKTHATHSRRTDDLIADELDSKCRCDPDQECLMCRAAAALREAQERIATEVVAYNSTVDALNAARLYAEDDRDKWESCATTAMAALDALRALLAKGKP